MALKTYADFLNAIIALKIAGVRRVYDAPPLTINSADLPIMYPMLPSGDEIPLTFSGSGVQFPQMSADMIVIYEAVQQNQHNVNLKNTTTMMDNVAAVLRGGKLNERKNSFSLNVSIVPIGSIEYYAVVATVTS